MLVTETSISFGTDRGSLYITPYGVIFCKPFFGQAVDEPRNGGKNLALCVLMNAATECSLGLVAALGYLLRKSFDRTDRFGFRNLETAPSIQGILAAAC